MKNRLIFFLFMIVVLTGCNNRIVPVKTEKESQDALMLSVLWYQKSAEMRALYYQCYKNAEDALKMNMAIAKKDKPFAVILDIDETVLDNSPFEAWEIINNASYSDEVWDRWVQKACAKALPGAAPFTRHADSLGVEVFYVSNRTKNEMAATLKNLNDEGFADADSLHLFLKESTSSKNSRREKIMGQYDVLLFIGDNLGDMDGIYEKRPDAPDFDKVEKDRELFGSKYIILPNPMYGTWLSPLLKKTEGKTDREKILKLLEGF